MCGLCYLRNQMKKPEQCLGKSLRICVWKPSLTGFQLQIIPYPKCMTE